MMFKYYNLVCGLISATLALICALGKSYGTAIILVICTAVFHTFYNDDIDEGE